MCVCVWTSFKGHFGPFQFRTTNNHHTSISLRGKEVKMGLGMLYIYISSKSDNHIWSNQIDLGKIWFDWVDWVKIDMLYKHKAYQL